VLSKHFRPWSNKLVPQSMTVSVVSLCCSFIWLHFIASSWSYQPIVPLCSTCNSRDRQYNKTVV